MKQNGLTIDFENSIGPWLGKTIKILEHQLITMLHKDGLQITKDQMVVLIKLYLKDGLNQNELAFLVLRDKSSLTRMLKTMERKGYIKRQQSTEDKRINNVFLTDFGRATFHRVQPILKNLMALEEQGISNEEKQTLIKILKKIHSNFGEKPELL